MRGVARHLAGRLVAACALLAAVGPTPAAAAGTGWRAVEYGGVRLDVPAAWPVYDLARDPTRCVRLDVHAVYLGRPGAAPACPARLLGRTEAVQVEPADPGSPADRRATRAVR